MDIGSKMFNYGCTVLSDVFRERRFLVGIWQETFGRSKLAQETRDRWKQKPHPKIKSFSIIVVVVPSSSVALRQVSLSNKSMLSDKCSAHRKLR